MLLRQLGEVRISAMAKDAADTIEELLGRLSKKNFIQRIKELINPPSLLDKRFNMLNTFCHYSETDALMTEQVFNEYQKSTLSISIL